MTDTNPRELIQRLADALTNAIRIIYNEDGTQHISTATPVLDEARVFLSQPEPEGLTDEGLEDIDCIIESNFGEVEYKDDVIRQLCDAVCKNFPSN